MFVKTTDMKLKANILCILLLVCLKSYGHKDVYKHFTDDEITSLIITGFEKYEEINKVKIFNKLANDIAKELNYREPLFIKFKHIYIEDKATEYFVRFSDVPYALKNQEMQILNLTFVGSNFNISKCLQIVEYAIKNVSKIAKIQQPTHYTTTYDTVNVLSVNPKILAKESLKSKSLLVKKVSGYKTYAIDSEDIVYGYTYYWQNDKFTVERIDNKIKSVAFTLNDIKYFYNIYDNLIIFESQNCFYYLDNNDNSVSKKQELATKSHRPYYIKAISLEQYLISEDMYSTTHTFYWPPQNLLIENMEERLLKRKN